MCARKHFTLGKELALSKDSLAKKDYLNMYGDYKALSMYSDYQALVWKLWRGRVEAVVSAAISTARSIP